MKLNTRILVMFTALVAVALLAIGITLTNRAEANDEPGVQVHRKGERSVLFERSLGEFHSTDRQISSPEIIRSQRSSAVSVHWQETDPAGEKVSKYALSLDGRSVGRIHETDYSIKLRYAKFDPLVNVPRIPEHFAFSGNGTRGQNAYIVQFVTQPLEEYREAIRELGGKVYTYLPDFAHIVQMDDKAKQQIEELPFVRWVGKYESVYKLDEELIDGLLNGRLPESAVRYNVMVLERGERMQNEVAGQITAWNGNVVTTTPEGFILEAELTPEQLLYLSNNINIEFIDRWSPPETDMNIVRATGGADFIENTLGYTGQGVRAEVMDSELRTTHQEFQAIPPVFNYNGTNAGYHGTGVYGIVFAQGAHPDARGMLPGAQGIFSHYSGFGSRYTHTANLLLPPNNAVFQTNSWGSAQVTTYNTTSSQMDDILFQNDIIILQSQSNTGNQNSRPQAWAKNIVSVGGIRHYNTASFDDDRWANGASVGPAADGRIKPDLAHFYDSTYAPHDSSNTAYTNFGGTSGATPITAGHFGIFFQMWHNGLFGNPTAATVFESRPRASTTKAMMINTAAQWNMAQPGTDITRVRQGWGRANVENLYNLRNKMFIVNEGAPLTNLQTRSYSVRVPAGSTDPLKVTMVYKDPAGSPSASVARINDITLRVTSPSGTVYWGNHGLNGSSMWSTSGGSANTVDTVENVFIQSPETGVWTIQVIASELNADARPQTPGVIDADFALVASGIEHVVPTSAPVAVGGRVTSTNGRGINAAVLTLEASDGTLVRATTNQFGYYTFPGIISGEAYVMTVSAKGRTFDPSSIKIQVEAELSNVDFVSTN